MSPPSQDVIRQDSDVHWCFINIEGMVHNRMFSCMYIHTMEFLHQHLACTLSQYTFVWCKHSKYILVSFQDSNIWWLTVNHQVINSSSEIIPLVKVDPGSSDQRLPNSIIPSLWKVPFSLWVSEFYFLILTYGWEYVVLCLCSLLVSFYITSPRILQIIYKDRFIFRWGWVECHYICYHFFICSPAHGHSDSFHFLAIMN